MNDPEIDRILAMTDDEVLAEARADGIDPEQNAIELRALFDRVAAFTDRPFEMMTDINGKPIPRWQERLEQMYTDGVPFGEILGYVRWLLRQFE